MDPKALDKAKKRFRNMVEAIEGMRSTGDIHAVEKNWSNFLAAHHTVFAILEQGAKSGGASKGWFDKVKHHRKNDSVLKYLLHARNCEDHTIEESSEAVGPIIIANTRGIDMSWAWKVTESGPNHQILAPGIKLKAVMDRGVKYSVPFLPPNQRSHSNLPLHAAEICQEYMDRIIQEASELVPS